MDLFARDKVFSIRSLLWSSSNLRTNGCCSHSRTWRIIEKKEEERTRKSRNIRRRLHSRFFPQVFFFVRLDVLLFSPWTLQLLIICSYVCSRKTCSVEKFDYIYNTKNDEGISSGACKKLNLSSILSLFRSFSMNEEGKEKTNCAYNIYIYIYIVNIKN